MTVNELLSMSSRELTDYLLSENDPNWFWFAAGVLSAKMDNSQVIRDLRNAGRERINGMIPAKEIIRGIQGTL